MAGTPRAKTTVRRGTSRDSGPKQRLFRKVSWLEFRTWLLADGIGDRDPARCGERLRAPFRAPEALALVSVAIIVVASSGYQQFGIDWEIFEGAADGEMISNRDLGYYYAYWLLPLFDLFGLAGGVAGVLWSLTNVAGVWFAARVFGARPELVLIGFGAISGFFTGTITGVAAGALAGMWWAAHEQRWTVVGLASLVAVSKPQWGVPLAAMIAFSVRPPLVGWIRMAVAPAVAVAASLAIHGWWPGEILDRTRQLPPEGNGSLWFFLDEFGVGALVLVLWAPLALPMTRQRRLALVAATSMMAVPYVQQYDFTILWLFFADGIGLFSYAYVVLYSAIGWTATRAVLVALPALAYVSLVRAPVAEWWRGRSADTRRSAFEQPA